MPCPLSLFPSLSRLVGWIVLNWYCPVRAFQRTIKHSQDQQRGLSMKTVAWLSFWLVAAIWGSSFLLIRVGVEQFTPGQVAFIRCLIAAIGLNAVMLMRGRR